MNWGQVRYFLFLLNDFGSTCYLPIGDAYIGLKFIESTDTLYGWVRCTATNNSITVKDFAYNTIPNMPILAGQTELGIGNFAPSSNINIFENSGFLYVNITYPAQAQGYIKIYSQQGALVKADSINGQQNTIPLAGLAQGIYIVQVATQSEIVNKQIFLQKN
ncbi:MAG: T9SS type A sorting domain-containing protein [Bacteroidales bacterium]|nr:T9SS type A sorting domain-containing protein [Bacteroidales bacterium]